jgi:L-ascorbate metabolism protein UlaG (beta-lactamase superfamily)
VTRGGLDLRFIGHSTVLLELDGIRILTDPFLRSSLGPLERHGVLPTAESLGRVDIVLISHDHPDHFDPASLRAIPGSPMAVVARGLGPASAFALGGVAVELTEGEQVVFGTLTIRAVPAKHWMTPRGRRVRPIGYVLDAGSAVYFAGDTGRFEQMRQLTDQVDVALVPVWTWGPHRGPGHLGPRAAAEVVRDMRPRVAVPIHWGTLYPRRLHRIWRAPLLEPGDRFAAHVADLAPAVDVRVLRPGEATSIAPASGEPRG